MHVGGGCWLPPLPHGALGNCLVCLLDGPPLHNTKTRAHFFGQKCTENCSYITANKGRTVFPIMFSGAFKAFYITANKGRTVFAIMFSGAFKEFRGAFSIAPLPIPIFGLDTEKVS